MPYCWTQNEQRMGKEKKGKRKRRRWEKKQNREKKKDRMGQRERETHWLLLLEVGGAIDCYFRYTASYSCLFSSLSLLLHCTFLFSVYKDQKFQFRSGLAIQQNVMVKLRFHFEKGAIEIYIYIELKKKKKLVEFKNTYRLTIFQLPPYSPCTQLSHTHNKMKQNSSHHLSNHNKSNLSNIKYKKTTRIAPKV